MSYSYDTHVVRLKLASPDPNKFEPSGDTSRISLSLTIYKHPGYEIRKLLNFFHSPQDLVEPSGIEPLTS